LLNRGDEVLVPSPDYPLWTAGVTLNQGKPVHYPCLPESGHQPDLDALEHLITSNTRAIVIINPNNPTGVVYSRETLEGIVGLAERHDLVIFSDEIYDEMLYDQVEFVPMATLARDGICVTFSGLSKVYRACGYRVGWATISGNMDRATDYLNALELLASLRLCSNVPAQWAVQTALGGYQSIRELVAPGGRLYETRQAIVRSVAASRFLRVVEPTGSMYAFVGVDTDLLPQFDDNTFALDLLVQKHVLVAPGVSFNVDYNNYFRITLLPDVVTITDVFGRIEEVLQGYLDA
jgi:alanine-synthesizing transaminase